MPNLVKSKPATGTRWVVIAMVVGVAVGWLFPDTPNAAGFRASDLAVLSNLFLRMVKLMVAPLLFGTIVVGIAGHGDDLKRVGRLALRSIIYFEIVTTIALAVGLLAVNVVKPGVGVNLRGAAATGVEVATTPPTFASVLEHVIPVSFFDAAARNDALQITFFSILVGVAFTQVHGPARALAMSFCETITEVMFKLVAIVMTFAPLGIGGAIAAAVGKSGIDVLRNLGALVLTLYGSLVVFALFVLFPIAVGFRVPIRRFWRATKEPWLVAFSTASSEAALPLALRNLEALGVPRRIVSFVLPAGYTFNMDGTTLYLAMASVFVAQAAGVHMPLSQQVVMMLTLMLTSKGLAAVPRASLVILSGTLGQFGLPLEGVAVILGVDAVMDMARTSLNVVGNCLATVLLARWEGDFELTPEPPLQADAPTLRLVEVATAELTNG